MYSPSAKYLKKLSGAIKFDSVYAVAQQTEVYGCAIATTSRHRGLIYYAPMGVNKRTVLEMRYHAITEALKRGCEVKIMTNSKATITVATKSETQKLTQKQKSFLNSQPVSLSELMGIEFPPQRWLVEGLIPEAGITIIYGLPGVYKTRLVEDIAVSVASGKQWLDTFPTTQMGVLIIDEENGASLMQSQLDQLGAPHDLPIAVWSRQNFKINKNNLQYVLQTCKERGFGAVVLDPLVYVHDGDENLNHDMSPRMKELQILTDEGIAVILLHHSKKPNGTSGSEGRHALRGASAISGAVDSQIEITHSRGALTMTQHKTRRSRMPLSFKIDVSDDDEHLEFHYGGGATVIEEKAANDEKARNEVLRLLGIREGRNKTELTAEVKKSVKIGERRLGTILKDMQTSGLINWDGRGGRKSQNYFLVEKPDDVAVHKDVDSVNFPEVSIDDILPDSIFAH